MNGFSIIIAAHNEASVIERTLRSILANPLDRPLQVIVVANGCTDDTASRARAFAPAVEVVETEIAGKIHALNLGDQAARFFPRAFLDADIDLSDNALQKVADAFNDPECHLAAPTARHTYSGSNVFLAGYYRLWSALPYVRRAIMGMGFYAIDATMRRRFDQFPPITADDKFVNSLAAAHERRIVPGCYATVKMPRTFGDLLRVKTRWTYGNLELAATYPNLARGAKSDYQGAAAFLLRHPELWINLPTFILVYLYSRGVARRRFAQKNPLWERDDSTRPLARESRPAA